MRNAQNKKYEVSSDYKIQRLYRKRAKLRRKLQKNIFKLLFGLIVFALVQLIIIGVFISAFKSNRVIEIENTEQFTTKADSVEYRTLARSGKKASNNKLYIMCGSKDYLYQDLLCYHYDGHDLDEDLRTQTLTLTLEKDTDRVVALRGEKTVFYTLDDYNKTAKIRNTMGFIMLVVIELIYIAVLLLYLWCTDIPWRDIRKIDEKINNSGHT